MPFSWKHGPLSIYHYRVAVGEVHQHHRNKEQSSCSLPCFSFGTEIFSLMLVLGFLFSPFYYEEEYIQTHSLRPKHTRLQSLRMWCWSQASVAYFWLPCGLGCFSTLLLYKWCRLCPLWSPLWNPWLFKAMRNSGRYFQAHQKCCGCCPRALPFPCAPDTRSDTSIAAAESTEWGGRGWPCHTKEFSLPILSFLSLFVPLILSIVLALLI